MAIERIFLHAGLNKTGSTAIQRTLFGEKERLRQGGVSYWGISANHSFPIRLAFDTEEPSEPYWKVQRQRAARTFGTSAAVKRNLAQALAESQPTFVISGEATPALTQSDLGSLLSVLRRSCPSVTALFYVRDPRSLFHSTLQQRLKAGRTLDQLFNFVTAYRPRIEKFFIELGRENVVLRRFGARHFERNDLMSDFFSAIGRADLGSSFPAQHHNTAISHRAAAVLDAINRAAERDGATRSFRWLVDEFLRTSMPGEPFRATRTAVEDMLTRNKEDIDWMSMQIGSDLLAEGNDEAGIGADPPTVEDLGPLIYRLAAEVAALRAAEKHRLGELALAANRRRTARRLFEAALTLVPDHPATLESVKNASIAGTRAGRDLEDS
jgi:hypothetical protein